MDDGGDRDIAVDLVDLVDLIAFSSQGVSVVRSAAQPIRQGTQGVLITHRRQCVELRFDQPSP